MPYILEPQKLFGLNVPIDISSHLSDSSAETTTLMSWPNPTQNKRKLFAFDDEQPSFEQNHSYAAQVLSSCKNISFAITERSS